MLRIVNSIKFAVCTVILLLAGCSGLGTERYSCSFSGKPTVIFSFSELDHSVSLGGVSFYERESWTRKISISDEFVSLSYVQGMATQTDGGVYVGFKDINHYQFNRLTNALTIETKLDSIQTGPANWTHPSRLDVGLCQGMSDLSYWSMFLAALMEM